MTVSQTHTTIRWAARVATVPIFLFWGAFFLEHFSWFSNPSNLPPIQIFLMTGVHGLILAGLAISWKWETVGSILTIAAAAAFFSQAAGNNFILFTALTSIPAIMFLVLHILESRAHTNGEPAIPEGKTA